MTICGLEIDTRLANLEKSLFKGNPLHCSNSNLSQTEEQPHINLLCPNGTTFNGVEKKSVENSEQLCVICHVKSDEVKTVTVCTSSFCSAEKSLKKSFNITVEEIQFKNDQNDTLANGIYCGYKWELALKDLPTKVQENMLILCEKNVTDSNDTLKESSDNYQVSIQHKNRSIPIYSCKDSVWLKPY